MGHFTFFLRCPGCGAKNRVRLVSGKRVRVRCGNCGEPLPLDKRRVFAAAAGQRLKYFFGQRLPAILTALVDAVLKATGALFYPLRALWRRLPPGLRKRLGWAAIALLTVSYLVVENTLKLSSLLALVVLLALATAAIVFAAQGSQGLRRLFSGVVRRCPKCGHRYLGWLKGCPRCGE